MSTLCVRGVCRWLLCVVRLWIRGETTQEAREESSEAGAGNCRACGTVVVEVTPTQSILQRDNHRCGYCRGPAVQRDHYISKNAARRLPRAAAERENPRYQVAACRVCNESKGSLLRVAVNDAGLMPELEALTLSTYRTWDGTAGDLR